MGWFKKIRRKVERAVKKTYKKVDNFVEKKVERPVKKVVKKIATEVEDTVTGKNKYTRRGDQSGGRTAASKAAPRQQSEEIEASVETGSLKIKKRRKGKRALISAKAEANVGGEGGSGLNIPLTK